MHRGRFQLRYWAGGRQYAESFDQISKAKRRQREVAVDKDRGNFTNPSADRVLFDEWASYYLVQKLSIRPRTREKYESGLRNHLSPAFGRTPIGRITRDAVQEWVAALVKKGLSAETVRGHYDLLAAMMQHAADDGCIPKSPCRRIELPRVVRAEQRYLDEEEVERLAKAHPARYRALVYTASYLGLRWQEIAGLRRSLLDMRIRRFATLRVVTTIERSHGRYRAVDYGKSAAARRTLKMPDFLREILAWHLGAFQNDEWVFPAQEGGFLRYDNFYSRVWVPAIETSGLAPLKFHELRHSSAAAMVDEGADPLQVKRRMGHEDVRTTFNLYGHLFPDREDELVAALDRRRQAVLARDVDQTWTSREGEVIDLSDKRAADQGL
jgi:integrase